jgi:hypothetical protein
MKISEDCVARIVGEHLGATLGDERRMRRLLQVVEKMARDPGLSLPKALGSDAAVQGCYRLMNNPEVTFEAVHASHAAATAARAAEAQRVLLLHDTTSCTFRNLDPEELGYLPTGHAGFLLHVGLVLAADEWKRPLGVIHAETIHRDKKPRANRSKEPKKKRKNGSETAGLVDKEYGRWWRGILSSQELLQGVDVLHIADRESDSYELMAEAVAHGVKFVFRSRTNRRGREAGTTGDWSTVREVARACEGMLTRDVPLSRRNGQRAPERSKRHPPRKMRVARLSFSATRVSIPRPEYLPNSLPPSLELSLVYVVEENVPAGEPKVEWLLYTTEPVETAEQVAAIVDAYRARWTIEEFNAALKTGSAYETREFETRHALLNMLALSLPIACELLWLRSRARTTPEAPATEVLTPLQLQVLDHFSSYRLPRRPTANDALLAVAALGGHLRRNGPPGWRVLLAGMASLQSYTAGWQAALARAGRARKM